MVYVIYICFSIHNANCIFLARQTTNCYQTKQLSRKWTRTYTYSHTNIQNSNTECRPNGFKQTNKKKWKEEWTATTTKKIDENASKRALHSTHNNIYSLYSYRLFVLSCAYVCIIVLYFELFALVYEFTYMCVYDQQLFRR